MTLDVCFLGSLHLFLIVKLCAICVDAGAGGPLNVNREARIKKILVLTETSILSRPCVHVCTEITLRHAEKQKVRENTKMCM